MQARRPRRRGTPTLRSASSVTVLGSASGRLARVPGCPRQPRGGVSPGASCCRSIHSGASLR
eukprot:14189267-Alexandrium_andersonii.AAC.1